MTDNNPDLIATGAYCPTPLPHDETIVMGHGSGGKLSHDLIRKLFLPAFNNPMLAAGDDSALVPVSCNRLALSTDSHVVYPLFFPGGDIGRLAVCGTVNDLAMLGAQPLALTVGFILEEGLDLNTLQNVIVSMHNAAAEAGIKIVAGDTKVVQKGKGDQIYINTAGLGLIPDGVHISGNNAQPGDVVILSGTMGDHGLAVLRARGDLGFNADIESDVAPLNHLVAHLLTLSENIHVLRDPTRGGVATTLNEIARQSNVAIVLDQRTLPVRPAVAAACEMLGFDPLYIANEGKLLAFIAREDADTVLAAMRARPESRDAVIIGEVTDAPKGRVLMKTPLGSTRVVDMLMGELLPRIC